MEARIGVYICHCGVNIAGVVDVEELTRFAQAQRNVVVVRNYPFVCSDPGQDLIRNDIRDLNLNRIVVAACSPHLHEPTFRRAVASAGLNPYLLEMANIREHCSWVTEDHAKATEKAKALLSSAIYRVALHEPLVPRRVSIHPDALVVGGGIAGIEAALELAELGHTVYLVEREPSIGGHMAQLDKTFPTLDCSACILTPKMSQVRSTPNIMLMTYSEVVEVSGYVGNFKVKVRRKPRYVDESLCTGCGVCIQRCPWRTGSEFDLGLGRRKAIYTPFPQAVPNIPVIDRDLCPYFTKGTCQACVRYCEPKAIAFDQVERIEEIEVGNIILATGYDTFDPAPMTQYGYKRFPEVYTSLEFERMNSPTGPTGGNIQMRNGRPPQSVAILHCIGSRDKNYHEYCSRVCCMHSLKYSHFVKEKLGEDADVYQMYIDMRCFGKGYEEFYNRISDEGATLIRGKAAEVTDVAQTPEERGKLIVVCEDTLLGSILRVPVDMVILSVALEPRADAIEVARLFSIGRSADGFFLERHPKLDPVATVSEGVFIAGCAQGPKDIPDTVAQAAAAAARAMATIAKGWVELEAAVSVVDEAICNGCKICVGICPFNAISFDDGRNVAVTNEVLCRGCGLCAAACPSQAIINRHFTNEEILQQIEAILV